MHRVAPYLVREDLHQNIVFPQSVSHKQLVLRTQSHVLTDSYHSVVSENRGYLPAQEPDEACLLQSGRGDQGDISCRFCSRDGAGLPVMPKCGGRAGHRRESRALDAERPVPSPAPAFHSHQILAATRVLFCKPQDTESPQPGDQSDPVTII